MADDGRSLFRPLCLTLGGLSLLASFVCGGVSDAIRGCENTTLVCAGSPEGEIYTQHGAPDRVIELSNARGPNTRHWWRYLAIWDIEERHVMPLMTSGRRSQLCYLIENGKVDNGSFVGEGARDGILLEPAAGPDGPPRVQVQGR